MGYGGIFMKKASAIFLILIVFLLSSLHVFGNELENADKNGEENLDKRLLIVYRNDIERYAMEAGDRGLRFPESIQSRIRKSKRLDNLNMEILTIDKAQDSQEVINLLMEDEAIESVQEDAKRYYLSASPPNDPLYQMQWGLMNDNINLLRAWELLEDSEEVLVAVIDSGINDEHEDLKYRVAPGGVNFERYNDDRNDITDIENHGTAVSGVIAAQTNNNIGVAGVVGEASVRILPLKAGYYVSEVIEAIDYAVDMEVDVINISMGGPDYVFAEEEAIQRAINANIVVVAAVGNDAHIDNVLNYPGSYDNVLSVGSIDSDEKISYFSNYNSTVDLVAPGEGIYTTSSDGKYRITYGTSFSSPYVSAICALLKSMDKSLTPSEIENILLSTAMDRGVEGKDDYYGYGLINPVGAINMALVEKEAYNNFDEMAGVKLDKAWTIEFSMQLDSNTINTSNIYIVDSKYNFVDCNLSLLSDKKSVTITPKTNYNPSEEYSLIINRNVQSIDGEKLAKGVIMKFTTED